MANDAFRFGEFELDPANRHLSRGETRIELSGRYLDALALLVGESGQLISKDRFLDEVWRGVPVTDEALTQCIKELRKALADDAMQPRYIETVPKHGYRFLASVERQGAAASWMPGTAAAYTPLQRFLVSGLAGSAGGAIAGLIGGLLYGLVIAARSPGGVGALSVLLVLWLLTAILATIGGSGVGFGIAAARHFLKPGWAGDIVGGALGGMMLGAFARLLGQDAFHMLFGAAPQQFTGAFEGAMLGAAAGLAIRLAQGKPLARALLLSGLAGALAGVGIVAAGGRLLGGSLAALAQEFSQASLRLDGLGALFGEAGFGPVSQTATAAGEAGLFCASMAMLFGWAERHLARKGQK